MLNSVLCLSTSFCIAVGQNGTVDVFNGTTWTATTGNGGTGMLADVDCRREPRLLRDRQAGHHAADDDRRHRLDGAGRRRHDAADERHLVPEHRHLLRGRQRRHDPQDDERRPDLVAADERDDADLNGISCFQATTACVAVGAVAGGAADRPLHDRRHDWNAGTGTGTQALNGVACTARPRRVSRSARPARSSAPPTAARRGAEADRHDERAERDRLPSSSACYAVGRRPARCLKFDRTAAAAWTPQTSNTTQALNGVACVNAGYCFADGAVGTTIATSDGGTTWTQQGNPISGPTSAINATSIALNGAACNSARCFVGLGAQGDILTTPLLTVTVHATGVYGTTPSISLPANSPLISYSPAGEAANVTGDAHVHDDGRGREPGRVVPDHELHRARGRRLQRRLRLREQQLHRDQGAADGDRGQQVAAVRPGQPAADGDAQRLRARPEPRHLGRHRHGGLHDDRDAVLDRRHLPDHLHAGDARRGRTTASARSSPAR